MTFYIPRDILVEIFKYLDLHTLSEIAKVCKKYNEIYSDQVIWEGRWKELLNKANTSYKRNIYKPENYLTTKLTYYETCKILYLSLEYLSGLEDAVRNKTTLIPFNSKWVQ